MGQRFCQYELTPINRKLKSELQIGHHKMLEREGHILNLIDENGHTGTGELSPLPGLHRESLREAQVELDWAITQLMDKKFNSDQWDFESTYFNLDLGLLERDLSPSVVFCLESALLSWKLKENPDLVRSYFNLDQLKISVPINGLYIPRVDDHPNSSLIESWKSDGFLSMKIKIGRNEADQENSWLKELLKLSHQHDGPKFRLDGNRLFTTREFNRLLKDIPENHLELIEYFEEPLSVIEDWPKIYRKNKFPLGLDESLLQFEKNGQFPKGTKAIIIKPQMVGGIAKSLALIHMAQEKGFISVISSSFETEIGIKTLGLLAHYQNKNGLVPAGLGTLDFFSQYPQPNSPGILYIDLTD